MSDLTSTGLTPGDTKLRLKQLRELAGETNQKSMSLRLGLSPNAWRLMETGGGLPSADTLLRLADLGFSPTWVLTGQGPMRLDGTDSSTAPASALDDQLLAEVIELIEGWLSQHARSLAPAEKAKAIAAAYELCAERTAATEQKPAAFANKIVHQIMKMAS
jgi:transcriptional regulator with XRE-family HTH domain